ncbi:MAG: DEAD/DEAH box helicase family protein, partial [Microbacteriaceae bacterium]|nr:DEAD/DEAH box helicase family protein [Microbacteriaceae bacterium]
MAMKLHFEPNLDFQLDAIGAVVDLFRGQESAQSEFTVSRTFGAGQMGLLDADGIGHGNRLLLLPEDVLSNLRGVQLRNGLRPADTLNGMDFTVEMETGTGKTYVYLRTIFKLHQEYGFTKFVIVVPSIAIKEGTFKTLQITAEHLRALHGYVPFSQGNNYFLYDSSRLNQVRNFATDNGLQVMVVTVGAINKKDVNNLYKESEKTGDERPIDLIRATNPIVIVDEPQSVDGGLTGKGREALDAMNPLCTLRYSATHVDKHHMIYRLDAVDAYERQLVKQIEVASATVEDAHNRPYVRFIGAATRRGAVTARVELDVANAAGAVRRQEVTVSDGDNLEETTRR